MASRKKDWLPWPFRQLIVKAALTITTIVIGLYCGYLDSYTAFYVAVLIQALNNAYESYGLMKGYNRTITVVQTLAFLGAIVSGIIAVFSFAGVDVNTLCHTWIVVALLSIPVVHFLIEAVCLILKEKY